MTATADRTAENLPDDLPVTEGLSYQETLRVLSEASVHQHFDAFLDIAVTSGIPAAFLAIVWLVVVPVLDLRRSEIELRGDRQHPRADAAHDPARRPPADR